MANYSFPTDLWSMVKSVQFAIVPYTAHSPVSAFNARRRVSGPISRFWSVRATLNMQGQAGWEALSGFLDLLDDGVNKVRIHDPSRETFIGTSTPTTLAIKTDASVGATSITLKGLTPNQSVAMARGAHIGIGENLYRLTNATPSDANGEATVTIRPDLRQGVAANDAVNLNKPTGLFRLINSEGEAYPTIQPPLLSEEINLDFMEDPDFDA